ncbi:MAG: hypothetical protein NTY74_07450 [Ignavibacteriae bacterium]|nr:hypothetical protein [Ignavibacteriota bacterium]
MARIKNELTGRASGKVGQQIYRIRDGKTSLCALPASFKVSQSEKAVTGRSRFGLGLKLAHGLCEIPQLKYFWKNTSVSSGDSNSTPFNKMMKEIYPYVFKDDLDVVLPIVPGLGFIAEKSSATLANDDVTAVINAIGTTQEIDPAVEVTFRLACIVYCKTPLDERKAPYKFIWCISDDIPLNLATTQTISIALEGQKTTLFDMYSTHRAYFTLITLDADSVPVHYSDTFTSV